MADAVKIAVAELFRCQHCNSIRTRSLRRRANDNGHHVRRHECLDCKGRYSTTTDSSVDLPPKFKSRIVAIAATEKQCLTCGKVQPIENFRGRGDGTKGKRSNCKSCLDKNRAVFQLNAVLAQYGITREYYEAMLEKQSGRCAICNREGSGSVRFYRMAIDHCHETGKVRGLLCMRCNLGIGNFDDEPQRLIAAAEYIARAAQAVGNG